MAPSLDLSKYLDASTEAARRARVLQFSLLLATTLTLVSFINSDILDWTFVRVRLYAHPGFREGLLDSMRQHGIWSPSGKPSVSPTKNEVPALLDDYLNSLVTSDLDSERVVHVPVLGFSFDAANLGVFSGISLIVLQIVYLFALEKERENLDIAFRRASKNEDKDVFYELMLTRQVLTKPKSLPDTAAESNAENCNKLFVCLQILHRGFILLPVAVLAVLLYDLINMSRYRPMSEHKIVFVLAAEVFCFVCVLILTVVNWCQADRIHGVWTRALREIVNDRATKIEPEAGIGEIP